MNTVLIRVLTTGALLLPLAAYSQSSQSGTATSPRIASSTSVTTPAGQQQIQPIDGNHLTAKNLIGKQVFNRNGERIAHVSDVGLGAPLQERFTQPGRAPSVASAPATAAGGQIHLHLTVGGLLGGVLPVRTSQVSVPLNVLEYDRANDQFVLDVPVDQLTAIAQSAPTSGQVASTSPTPGVIGSTDPVAAGETWGSGATATETNAAGTGMIGANPRGTPAAVPGQPGGPVRLAGDGPARDLQRIEDALRRELGTQMDLSTVTLSFSGNSVVLSGTVANESNRERIGQVARAQTSLDVRNLLQLPRPLAAE